MRRLLMVAAAILVLGTASTAQAQVINMGANLSGANETPVPLLNGSFGTAVVRVDMGAQSISWDIEIFNMPSGTTNAHFHVGGPGLGGPTVVNIPFTANISNDYRLTGSATTATAGLRPDQGIRSFTDFLQACLGGQVYINIHSAVNGGGEIRGQLFRVP